MSLDNMRFTICHEKWADMTPSERGRLCAKCNKQIVDFTEMSTAEIERTHRETAGICGLYTVSQFRNPAPLIAATAAAALALGATAALTPSPVDAQDTVVSRPQAALATPIRVHGVVTDSGTKQPISGAQVTAFRQGAITNAEGKFEFTITTAFPAPLRITALMIGYKSITHEIARPDSVIELNYTLAQQAIGIYEVIVTGVAPPLTKRAERPSFFNRIWRSIRGIF